MIELFTKDLNSPEIDNDMKDAEAIENVGTDEMLFYNSIRADLQQIQMKPKSETIDNILHYSRNYAG
ncbi:hypothetical protein BEL04_17070 [Mucilaginibacter sp. PPCGB 2223]|nr:hypothetical protein BEL04_17070 [Mucilaginibacter sp. PPCGB 2223]